MFSRIVVGVDASSGGEDAIALACQLADDDAELVLCEVVVAEDAPTRATNRDYEAVTLDDARARLTGACARIDDAIVVSARVKVAPSVAHGLRDVASQAGAELIVVGSCGRGPIGRLLAGNDANETLHSAACPVALAPRGYAHDETAIERIGVGYNESIESEQALALAISLRGRFGATLEVIETLPLPWPVEMAKPGPVPTLPAERAEAQERLLAMPEVDDSTVLISGNPARALRTLAGRCALLVVGARPRSSFGRIVFSATSDSLTHGIPCPLLAVPRVPAPAATVAWATSARAS